MSNDERTVTESHLESAPMFREIPLVLGSAARSTFARIRCVVLAAAIAAFSAVAVSADTLCDFVTSGNCSCAGLTLPDAPTCPKPTAACKIELPRGFPCPNVPADNPITTEKIELGRFIFYDTRLSFGDRPKACASCHQQAKAFTDGAAHAEGATGQLHPRSAMSLTNIAYAGTLAWANPQLFTLEDQAIIPMVNTTPIELGASGKEDELLGRLRADTRYQRLFAEAFPGTDDPVTLDAVLKAIASFERTFLSGNSAYDRYTYGLDDHAISDSAIRGANLFSDEKRECFHCHVGFNLTISNDYQDHEPERPFINNGLYNLRCADFGLPELTLPWCTNPPTAEQCARNDSSQPQGCHCDGTGPQDYGCYPPPNTGAYDFTKKTEDMGTFKPPTLRNIAVTAPYMHDGSIATLEEVLDHYAAGGRTITDGELAGVGKDSPAKGTFVRGFQLTEQQKADLVEFLKTLTDDEFLANPRLSDPFQTVACVADCNFNGNVDVSELITAINVGLGTSSLAQCVVSDPSGDGVVAIDELLRAIHAALDGCG